VLSGTWNNPFDLCKGLTIKQLTGGLGIDYSVSDLFTTVVDTLARLLTDFLHQTFITTGMPSKVTLGGTFELYGFKGDMILCLGTNSTDQLIKLEMFDLDVAQFMTLICNMLGVTAGLSHGRDTFYIRHLLVYISTGVCIEDRQYPPGIEFDVDMTVLGSKATLHAGLSTSRIQFTGYVDAFWLGDLHVKGAREGDTGPSIDIEFSSEVQKFNVSGRIELLNDHLTLDVWIDNCSGEFYFFFHIVIADALKMVVKATLEGPMPEVVKRTDQVVVTDEDKEAVTGGEVGVPNVVGGLYAETGQKMERLLNKQFKLHALMEQRIIEYIVNLANEHFAKEGDPDRKDVLEREWKDAEKKLADARRAFDTKTLELSRIISSKKAELSSRNSELVQNREKAEAALLEIQSSNTLKERDLKMCAEVEQRKLEEEERAKTLAAENLARDARIAAEECKRSLMAQVLAKATRDSVEEARAAVESKFLSNVPRI
jgi:hypothetical protein